MAERARSGTQLTLLEAPASSWRLDDKTREVGRKGLAEARAALRSAGASGRSEHRPQAVEAA